MAIVKSDEKLAFKVRKFPCVYDISLSSYKENQPPKNAWKEIDQALGKPEGNVQKELVSIASSLFCYLCYHKRQEIFKT